MEKAKLLIIDDEREFLGMLKEKLELEGFEILTAGDGERGMESIKNDKPDLVICDINMPKKNGFDVLKDARQKLGYGNPFIMLTVEEDFEKIKEAYADKTDLYITKPVVIANLLKNIRTLLNLSKNKIENA